MLNHKFTLSNFVNLTVVFAFIGTSFLTFSVGPFHLFPFRVALLILWILWFFKGIERLKLSIIKVKRSLNFLVLWFVYSVLSLTWAIDKVSALKHIIFLFMNISVIFFIVYYLRDWQQISKLLKLWMFIYVLLLPIGFWEVTTGNHLSNSGLLNVDEGYEYYKFAPTTVFGNQNDYATLIALTIPMFYTSLRYTSVFFKRVFYIMICLLSVLMLTFTTSRANYLGVFLGFSFWFIFLLRLKGKLRVVAVISLILGLIAIRLTAENIEYLRMIWEDFSVVLGTQNEDAGVEVRTNLIKNGVYFMISSFGFGVGAGNIEYYMANYPKYFVGDITNVHNWWIEVLGNYGIWIFIAYMIYYISTILKLWKIYRMPITKSEKILCEALLCGLVAFSISSISSSSIMAFNPHWVYFGLTLAFINYSKIKYDRNTHINSSV